MRVPRISNLHAYTTKYSALSLQIYVITTPQKNRTQCAQFRKHVPTARKHQYAVVTNRSYYAKPPGFLICVSLPNLALVIQLGKQPEARRKPSGSEWGFLVLTILARSPFSWTASSLSTLSICATTQGRRKCQEQIAQNPEPWPQQSTRVLAGDQRVELGERTGGRVWKTGEMKEGGRTHRAGGRRRIWRLRWGAETESSEAGAWVGSI